MHHVAEIKATQNALITINYANFACVGQNYIMTESFKLSVIMPRKGRIPGPERFLAADIIAEKRSLAVFLDR